MTGRIAISVMFLTVMRLTVLHLTTAAAFCNNASVLGATDETAQVSEEFEQRIRPLLTTYCLRCHNADNMKSGIRIDQLDGRLEDRHLFLWKDILKQIDGLAMPPEDEKQPSAEERQQMVEWIQRGMNLAKSRDTKRNGSVRRLTVSQYRNTLKDLLGLRENLADVLPPDGVSREGFTNNAQTMVLSPLQMEYYFDIAEKSLDLCIVDELSKPVIQNFRVDLGTAVNDAPCPDQLILGADSLLLNNDEFTVTELQPVRPFDYTPFLMRKSYDFIEGYAGNDTVRGWRHFDSIYHSVFACMRGTRGYPLGQPYCLVPGGLLLRPAIPSTEVFGQSSTYGPMANFKVSLRELPDHGDFRVTVVASKYQDGLLLNSGAPMQTLPDSAPSNSSTVVADMSAGPDSTVHIEQGGVYQVDVCYQCDSRQDMLSLTANDRQFSRQIDNPEFGEVVETEKQTGGSVRCSAFMLLRLTTGPLKLSVSHAATTRIRKIILTLLPVDSDAARTFEVFERRTPLLGVHLGLRRDCGSTLTPVEDPVPVHSVERSRFVFEGAINDFPTPDVEWDNVNYLAGFREIGIRSEYTDGRALPRLQIHSVEFEGPLYSSWPPETHRRIFIDSSVREHPQAYAKEVLQKFAQRAWRRPVSDSELNLIYRVWENSWMETGNFQQSIKEALLVVLTSPQFLFLTENSSTPEPDMLDSWELASKLSYFLWNTAPDDRLRDLADQNRLHESLSSETDRLIRDPKCRNFVQEFASQWLSLDKFDVVEVDQARYPELTRDTRKQLRQEPVEFLHHLIQHNLPLRNLVQSDFIVANDVVADYYNLAGRSESGLQFVALSHEQPHLGGVLSQAGILAGLSDGRESNPIKRGAWLARKIIADPPDDPPPNVPQLMDDPGKLLTLREKLELHRNQEGCVKCHSGIDPWGVPFETFDAGGLLKKQPVEAHSTLPDGTQVHDLTELKALLATEMLDQVAFSFLKHLASYATGRSLTYNETEFIRENGRQLRTNNYRLQDMIHFVVSSDLFLKK